MTRRQHTLAQPVTFEGMGLHSGEPVSCTLQPAPPDSGRYFVRTDLPQQPLIPAHCDYAVPAGLSTLLVKDGARIRTVEHLLGALAGLEIDNCRVEVDREELPILDGSALPYVEAITPAPQAAQPLVTLSQPLTIYRGDAFVSAIPSAQRCYTYGINFPDSPIGQQWFTWRPECELFAQTLAPARTFTRQRDIAPAQAQGLIKGGSLDNAIVCTETAWLTPLRFPDEPVRHKLLDLLGDLSLTGHTWQAHIIAYKAGHALHGELAQALLRTLV